MLPTVSERLLKVHPREAIDKLVLSSDEWLRLQFWPRNPYSHSALRYTGRFQVKYAVQACQMRKSYPPKIGASAANFVPSPHIDLLEFSCCFFNTWIFNLANFNHGSTNYSLLAVPFM